MQSYYLKYVKKKDLTLFFSILFIIIKKSSNFAAFFRKKQSIKIFNIYKQK